MALDKERFEWLLSKGLRHGGSTHSVEDVISALHSGELKAHFSEDGMIMTKFAEYPERKVLELFMAIGDQDAISKIFSDQVVDYGHDVGADYVRAIVRPGLVDLFKSLGAKSRGTMMYRPLATEV